MQTIVLTIHLIIIFALSGIILLQRNEGGGLGIGGGGNQGGLGGRAAANPLTRVTWILAAGFIATSIILTVLASQESRSTGVLDGLSGTAPNVEGADDGLLPPALDGDALLPPSLDDTPAQPPAAE